MSRYNLLLAFALCVSAALLSPPAARAQSGDIIYGCYGNSNGQLRRVNSPTECKNNETALVWALLQELSLSYNPPISSAITLRESYS
jgi:hypothetical protein